MKLYKGFTFKRTRNKNDFLLINEENNHSYCYFPSHLLKKQDIKIRDGGKIEFWGLKKLDFWGEEKIFVKELVRYND